MITGKRKQLGKI